MVTKRTILRPNEKANKQNRASSTVASPALKGWKDRAVPSPEDLPAFWYGGSRQQPQWYLLKLSSEPELSAPGSQSPFGRSSSEAGWRVGRKANGKRAKVILKNRVGNPVTGEVTKMVLTCILWKRPPLISA